MREAGPISDDVLDTLTVDELRTSIQSFTQADLLRLRKVACLLCGGTDYEWNDLINEAIARALAESRRCPRTTRPIVFLGNAMKSIVSDNRESRSARPETTSLAATGTDGNLLALYECV